MIIPRAEVQTPLVSELVGKIKHCAKRPGWISIGDHNSIKLIIDLAASVSDVCTTDRSQDRKGVRSTVNVQPSIPVNVVNVDAPSTSSNTHPLVPVFDSTRVGMARDDAIQNPTVGPFKLQYTPLPSCALRDSFVVLAPPLSQVLVVHRWQLN
ncbi:MAG: hypothetical protein IPF59_14195 [Ignavibacteria bacterium]|nr:hypothetical protein [Ignavibacteria bacterium]